MQRRHYCRRDRLQDASLFEGDTQGDVPDHYVQRKSQSRTKTTGSGHFRAALQTRCERLLLCRRKGKEGDRGSLFTTPWFLRVLARKGARRRLPVSLLRDDKILAHRLPHPVASAWMPICAPPR